MSLDIWEQAARAFDVPDVFSLIGYVPHERQREFHAAREFDVLFGGQAGGGKAIRVDEWVPTLVGWARMGALRAGDQVFDERGIPCRVTAAYPVIVEPVAYRLTFDDGSTIEADADHQWLTFTAAELLALTCRTEGWRGRRRARRSSRATGRRSELFTATITARNQRRLRPPTKPAPAGAVRTTKEIAETLLTPGGRRNHAIPVAGPLTLPAADLPLDPYALGAWLGDGTSISAGFTSADEEIVAEIRAAGVPVQDLRREGHRYAWWLGVTEDGVRSDGRRGPVNSVRVILSGLGVVGDKHIPVAYLRASVEQRLALLQGLMDTDGTVNKVGRPSFTTTCPRLADDFYELVVSLGWKTGRTVGRASLYGRDCGPRWTFRWSPDRVVFRLPRKADRQVLGTRRTTRFRYVVACERVASSPMRCISVDSPSCLFLAGRQMVPTHNSIAVVAEGIRVAALHPGLRVLTVRRTYDELAESIFPALRKFAYAEAVGARWNGTERELRFPNGSLIRYRYLETLEDASRRQGGEYQLLCVDEATLMPPGVVDILRFERLRSAGGLPVIGVRASSNPGGSSHGAVRSRYIDATDHGTKVAVDEHGNTVRFISSSFRDNPHLDLGYESRLNAIPDPQRRAAMRDGEWSQFAGMMFSELSWDRHTLFPVDLPDSWLRYSGVDWGYAAPWCVLWAAVDEDGRVWVYRELYETLVGEADQARRILAAEVGEQVTARFADDAMWATRGDAKPIAEVYSDNGVFLTRAGKGPGSRVAGWQRWHSYLADAPACVHHRSLGWDTCPRVHIFRTCPKLWYELENLSYHVGGPNPEDADPKAPDHACDAGRYLLLNIGSGPEFPVLPPRLAASGFTVSPDGRYAVRAGGGPALSRGPVWDEVPVDESLRGGVRVYW